MAVVPKTLHITTYDKSVELNKQIENLEKKLKTPSPFYRRIRLSYWAAGLIIFPLGVFVLLFLFRPSFVLTRTKDGLVRDRKKLVRWTLVWALVGYATAYLYACYTSSPPTFSFSPEILKS